MMYYMFPQCLHDNSLRLRPLRIGDGRFMAAGLTDETIVRACGISKPPAVSLVSLMWWVRKTYPLAFCVEVHARRIGFLGLYNLRPRKSATLSLAIFDEACRSQGYGTRVLKLFMQYMQQCSLLHHLAVDVRQDNQAALNFWKKSGFSKACAADGVLTMTWACSTISAADGAGHEDGEYGCAALYEIPQHDRNRDPAAEH
jgi:GNAT superfamily N-acetyltransferase